ncbi:hypothetical protein JD969_02855 [Planctomycetota bacterium]|nr:hypothetical protein JD969_02855 [Planctomycetota bacterium]
MIMEKLPSVLLRHETDEGAHFDWLLGVPGVRYGEGAKNGEEARLWTWRIEVGSDGWEMGKRYEMVRNFDHRETYLTYEGEISGGRGMVVRVDEGEHEVVSWREQRIETRLRFEKFVGIAELRCIKGEYWCVVFHEAERI